VKSNLAALAAEVVTEAATVFLSTVCRYA